MKLGFIDYYLDEWHANNYPKWIEEASGGRMKVVKAYGHIDSPIGGRTTDQWCGDMDIPRAMSIDEIVSECDGIIVLSPDNCEMHEILSEAALKSGKPTYIDKTFASDLAMAKRIFDLAEAHGTPCYSTSALRYADEYRGLSGADHVTTLGPNGFDTYSIHQLEPMVMLLGAKARRVRYAEANRSYTMHIEFEGGKTGDMTGVYADVPFLTTFVKGDDMRLIRVESDFFRNFIVRMVGFFDEPKPLVSHAETLQIMAIRTAGLEAMKRPGEWVTVEG